MNSLDDELDATTRELLVAFGFDRATFEAQRERLARGAAEERDNRLQTQLQPPLPEDVSALPAPGSEGRARLHERGMALIHSGKVAAAVLAGGMATRFGGVVKAGVEVIENLTFLELKLRDIAQVARAADGKVPVYLMTSFATHARVTSMAEALAPRGLEVQTFPQFISLRLTDRGELFRDAAGKLSPYAPGHGDLVFALRRVGALAKLRAAGVNYLFMSNVDNLAATLDPAIVGAHVERASELTFEVAALAEGDKGGVPARVDGKLQVIEALRYPLGFEERDIPLFSTNSFVLDLAAIDRDFELSWFRVTKQVDGRPAIQFERLVNQLTAFVRTHGLAIERTGPDSRFLPVKDPAELTVRLPEIRRVLEARGAL
jgi:UTP--glucose-1-phosphate uridylyltransferase